MSALLVPPSNPRRQIPRVEHIPVSHTNSPMQFHLVLSWWHSIIHFGEVTSTAESSASPQSKEFDGEGSFFEKGRYISALNHFHFHPAVISQVFLLCLGCCFLFPLLPQGLVEQQKKQGNLSIRRKRQDAVNVQSKQTDTKEKLKFFLCTFFICKRSWLFREVYIF